MQHVRINTMKSLKDYIYEARKNNVAIGRFNISNLEALWGIFNAARKLNVPVLIGTSEGEREFIGPKQAVALVRSLREEFDYPIFLNADHTYSYEKVVEAVDVGYDAVIFDGAKIPFEENIKITKKCVEYAKSKNPEILVEGELGYIGQSSKILDAIPEGVELGEESLTKPEEAARYVKETGIDLFAPAVGNIHGMLKGGVDPKLNVQRVKEIYEAVGVPLVLHGGSGNSEDDFKNTIKEGVAIVHINTEIRVAYKKGLQLALQELQDEVAPYKFLRGAMQEVEKIVEKKLALFNDL